MEMVAKMATSYNDNIYFNNSYKIDNIYYIIFVKIVGYHFWQLSILL